MRLKGLEKVRRIYFIGLGGISMSALAKLCATLGYIVSGSDITRAENMKNLTYYGVSVYVGSEEKRNDLNIADLVIYTDAVPCTDVELMRAKALGKRILSRAEFLSIVCDNFNNVISVAGSHGKTTCTAMTAHIFRALKTSFTAHIGGEDVLLGNFFYSGNEYFVTEACEYKKNFLKLRSTHAIVLNIDKDHMECYDGLDDLTDSFKRYCLQANNAFVCADDSGCKAIENCATFGIVSPLADYRATDIRCDGERYSFTVEEYGRATCRVRLKCLGRHNVYNALAGYAVARSFGFEGKLIAEGLGNFTAVRRRFEKIGTFRGASCICDYAHHPREIAATIKTAQALCKKRLYVVFQPHTYSRTKLLMNDFLSVLVNVKELMIYKTYPARESYDEEGSAFRLAKRLGALYAENIYSLKTWLKMTVKEGDSVLFLGAGDLYYVAQYILRAQ